MTGMSCIVGLGCGSKVGDDKRESLFIGGLAVSGVVCCSPGGVVLGRDDLTSLSLRCPREAGGSVVIFTGALKKGDGLY
jgi:hypothetical protein